MERAILSILIFIEREIMKVQLKFRNKVYENYLIDENGIIYDLDNIPQKTYLHKNRPCFKGNGVHAYVVHSFIGYVEKKVIHHINENKHDNSLSNLVYMDHREHSALHNFGKSRPQSVKDAIKKAKIGNTIIRGRIWVNNGVISKMVYPNEIPEGFVSGRIFVKNNK